MIFREGTLPGHHSSITLNLAVTLGGRLRVGRPQADADIHRASG